MQHAIGEKLDGLPPNGLAFSGWLEESTPIDQDAFLLHPDLKIALIQPLRCNAGLDGNLVATFSRR
jgi:hypothetical protein